MSLKSTLATQVSCVRCGSIYPLNSAYLYTCTSCGGILDIEYDYPGPQTGADARQILAGVGVGHWKYRALLPIRDSSKIVSLGEGGTPLLRCDALGRQLGLNALYVKNEATNPTGSFKDRPVSVAVSKARESEADTIVMASSGNAAASMAAYAARAGMKAIVLVPAGTPVGKILQMQVCGSKVIAVNGTYADAFALARRASRELGWINASTTYLSPYPTEGDKTVAYEVVEQLAWNASQWVLVPVGAGPLLAGIYKGFKELRALGVIQELPAMVAVQAAGCAPIVRAYETGAEEVSDWGRPKTIASAIADSLAGYAQDGTHTLHVIRESGGVAVQVSDAEMLEAIHLLASAEGVFAESSGAASVAGLIRLVKSGTISAADSVVCVVTGHGLKDTKTVEGIVAAALPSLEPDEPDLDRLVEAAR